MKAALVLNGNCPRDDDWTHLADADLIVCADGATDHMLESGYGPDVVVGDLDSLDQETLRWAESTNVDLHQYPGKKDATDGELALQLILERKADEIVILGGHGGRTAMFLANMKLLVAAAEAGVIIKMVGEGETIYSQAEGSSITLELDAGQVVNAIPIQGPATISIEGTGWDGTEVELAATSGRGCSNLARGDAPVTVSVLKGKILLIVEDLE